MRRHNAARIADQDSNTFWFLICTMLVFIGAFSLFAQPAPRPIRRHLEVQTYDVANPRGPYLGQKPPGAVPKVFAPGFISTAENDEYAICFSPDGNEIYFSRLTPSNSNSIWVTRQIDGGWTLPRRGEFTGNYYNSEPFITQDNTRMYFVSIRDGGSANFQLWTMDRAGASWSIPRKLGSPFSTNTKMFPTAANNGNLYFTEFINNQIRILMARNTGGSFATPVPLDTTINSFPGIFHAFIAPDESYLLFDATPGGPHIIDNFLYVSYKGTSGEWLPPVKLDNTVNSTSNQDSPSISPDGRYLFFTRRNGTRTDIWWVDAKVVFDLKPIHSGENE